MKTVTVKILRSNARIGMEPIMQEYQVPIDDGQSISIQNLLEYIYENLDSSLAFFKHAACRQVICGKCLVKANGKNVLACKQIVGEEELILLPFDSNKVVRDLICN